VQHIPAVSYSSFPQVEYGSFLAAKYIRENKKCDSYTHNNTRFKTNKKMLRRSNVPGSLCVLKVPNTLELLDHKLLQLSLPYHNHLEFKK